MSRRSKASAADPVQQFASVLASLLDRVARLETSAGLIPDGVVTNDKIAGSWTTATAATGWGASTYGTTLAYRRIGDVVFVFGAFVRTGANLVFPNAATITTLPVGFRPANNLSVVAINPNSAIGNRLATISTAGVIQVVGNVDTTQNAYLALAFPV
jgi:hypothetical protein